VGTILAGVAPNESERRTVQEAIKLALFRRGWLILVSIVPAYGGSMDLLHIDDARSALTEPHVQALQKASQAAKTAGLPFEARLEEGRPEERLADIAEDRGAEVIVLGTGARGAAERAILGSTAARVIGCTQADVLVVPPDSDLKFERILLATDGSPASRTAEDKAFLMASEHGARLWMILVIDVPSEYYLHQSVMDKLWKKSGQRLEEAQDRAKALGVEVETILTRGETPQEILDAAARIDADLIVMGGRKASGLKHFLMGGSLFRVLSRSTRAVWVTP